MGDIVGVGAIEVNGVVEGQIKCLSVKLGSGSRVNGNIIAEKAEIYGEVNGNVTAKTIICGDQAKIVGNIIHQRIDIKDGAYVEGNCRKFVQELVEVDAANDTEIKQAS